MPLPAGPRTRLRPSPWLSPGIVIVGSIIFALSFQHIVERVEGYASQAPPVTTNGVTERLTAGPWVVFVRCETRATFAPYGCPRLEPSDVVIRAIVDGTRVQTVADPSVDHISPDGLPASGRLTFTVPRPAVYELRLTRPVPKGVFVAESPGSIARSLAWAIVVGALGIVVVVIGVVLLVRRVSWRLQRAPRVFVGRDRRRGWT